MLVWNSSTRNNFCILLTALQIGLATSLHTAQAPGSKLRLLDDGHDFVSPPLTPTLQLPGTAGLAQLISGEGAVGKIYHIRTKSISLKNKLRDIDCCPSTDSFRKADSEGSIKFRKQSRRPHSLLQCFLLSLPQNKKEQKNRSQL